MTSPGCPAEHQLAPGVENEVLDNHRQAADVVGQVDFDELLHSNVLDTLADFDFSGVDMSGLEPDAKRVCSPGGTRKRTFSVTEAWDSLSPKISNVMLAGAWENAAAEAQQQVRHDGPSAGQAGRRGLMTGEVMRRRQQSPSQPVASRDDRFGSGNGAPQRSSAVFRNRGSDEEEVAAVQQVDAPTNTSPVSISIKQEGCARTGGKRKSQAMSGGVKRPLNPDRMERKASREKRRREEVNEKFEQLLAVLEEAEATSGLAPPVPEHGQLGVCVNGRRVEVLSRTISILRTLLRERRERSAGDTTGAAGAPIFFEHVPCASPHSTSAEEEAAVIGSPLLSAATLSSTADSSPVKHETSNSLTPSFHAASTPRSSATATVLGVPAAAATPPAAPPVPGAGTVQHVAIPLHQHPHAAAMAVPPGFAMAHHHAGMVMSTGMPQGQMAAGAAHMLASVHGMQQHPGMQSHNHAQPFFIAVPMYMPPGPAQGVVAPAAATSCAVASNAAAASQAATPAPAETASAADAAGTAARSSAEGKPCVPEKPDVAALGKDGWPMPGAVGFPPMMLQMPQFVMQALSAEDGDEKVTHAMCA